MRKIVYLIVLLVAMRVESQVIKSTSFEVMPVNYDLQLLEGSRSYSVTQNSARKRFGNYSARFELRASDPEVTYGNKRAEITVFNNYSATDSRYRTDARWYKLSTYQAASEWKNDTREEIFPFQFHDKSNNCSSSPNLAMEVINGRFRVKVRYSTQNYCQYKSSIRMITTDLIPVPFDQWNDWVIYYNPRTDALGEIIIWLNGVEIYKHNGPCMYIGSQFPYMKVGIYKWVWMSAVPSGLPTVRVGYIDSLKVGGANENWKPVIAAPEPPPNVLPGLSVKEMRSAVLSAVASDSDGKIVSYLWSTGENTPSIIVQGEKGVIKEYSCTVTDDRGGKKTQNYSITF